MDEPPIQPASTVMLIRDADPCSGQQGVQVFMLRRTQTAVFAGGMYVFPGGRVDATDGEPDSDWAFRVAAIRECFEEAGVLLATIDGKPIGDDCPALRHRYDIHDATMTMDELCQRYNLRLAVEDLVWLQHWITPRGETPRRFDTRFYVVAHPSAQHSETHDEHETVASMWVTASEALHAHHNGRLVMLPPTVAALQFLADHPDVDSTLAAARRIGVPEVILPKIAPGALTEGLGLLGLNLLMPGDPGYDELD
ncbi:MAG TPA: NUDIX hydrolase [Ilumatobacteraceae bacterium]|nr:NUDIX hydrolase [Ilumatobacteraceae bacterium]